MHNFVNRLCALTGLAALLVLPAANARALSFEDALRAGLANSHALSASRNAWLSAREEIGTAAATTEWRATGSYVANEFSTRREASTNNGFERTGNRNASITLSRNLYDGGQKRENTRLKEIELEIARERYRAAEQTALLQIIEAYLLVITLRQQVEANTSNVERLVKAVALAELNTSPNVSISTSRSLAQARLERARFALIASRAASGDAQDRLFELTGLDAGDAALTHDIDIDTGTGRLPGSIGAAERTALRFHPQVRIASRTVDARRKQLDAVTASVKPNLALTFSATDFKEKTKKMNNLEYQAQIRFTTSLLPTGAVRARARSLTANIAAAIAGRDDALQQVRLGARSAYRGYEAAKLQLGSVEKEFLASRRVHDETESRYQFGAVGIVSSLDASQDLLDAEIRKVTAQHNIIASSFGLRAATGTLTTEALGMVDVLGPLDDIEPLVPKFKHWIRMKVVLPEELRDDTELR